MQNIVPLPGVSGASREVGHYVRLGDTGHKILEDLVAEGRFPVQRVVVDASRHKQLRKPVIADYVGGLVGFAGVAFSAVSGLSLGIGEKQRFGTSTWHSRPEPRSGDFGRAKRMSIPGIKTSLTTREIGLPGQTPAGRRLVACKDRDCCENGLKTMLENPRRHLIKQVSAQLEHLGKVPLENRPRQVPRRASKHTKARNNKA